MTPIQVAQEFQVDLTQGLSTVDALVRLKKYGPNVLDVEKKSLALEAWERIYRHFLPLALFVAALIILLFSYQLGASLSLAGLAIFSMVLGVYQDVKTEMHGASLKKTALVRRDGQLTVIDSTDVVPGDVAIISAGTHVPADGRLYVAARLCIDETVITGSSGPAWKTIDVIEKAQARPGVCINMAFMNTTVTHGYGTMIVTSTGMNTEIGTSLGLLHQRDLDKKPLQVLRRLMALDFATVAFMSKG